MSETNQTNLSERMRNLAKTRTDLLDGWLTVSDAFDEATKEFFGSPQTVSVMKFMGCLARARKMWCEVTGEPLV